MANLTPIDSLNDGANSLTVFSRPDLLIQNLSCRMATGA